MTNNKRADGTKYPFYDNWRLLKKESTKNIFNLKYKITRICGWLIDFISSFTWEVEPPKLHPLAGRIRTVNPELLPTLGMFNPRMRNWLNHFSKTIRVLSSVLIITYKRTISRQNKNKSRSITTQTIIRGRRTDKMCQGDINWHLINGEEYSQLVHWVYQSFTVHLL